MHTVLLEETYCCAVKWLLLPGAGQSVFKLQLLRSPSAQDGHWACLVLCTHLSRCCPGGPCWCWEHMRPCAAFSFLNALKLVQAC